MVEPNRSKCSLSRARWRVTRSGCYQFVGVLGVLAGFIPGSALMEVHET